jgi:hypothetical protein
MEPQQQFDLDAFHEWCTSSASLSEANTKSVVRVVKKLVSGEGVAHSGKPGETFYEGVKVSLEHELEKMQKEAAEWLPYKGNDAVDKGHGYALNHPIQKMIDYKNYLSGVPLDAGKKKAEKPASAKGKRKLSDVQVAQKALDKIIAQERVLLQAKADAQDALKQAKITEATAKLKEAQAELDAAEA